MSRLNFISFALAIIFTTTTANANCLTEAADYTDRICGELEKFGSSSLIDASGNLNASAKGVISRVFGEAGGEAVIKGFEEKYFNVPRDQLSQELRDARGCRERIEVVARTETCRRPVVYATCRHPDFGRERWGSQETLTDATGWRGGWTQPAFCNDAINRAISARGLSGSPHESQVLKSWEEGKWGNATFRTNRQYRYHCQFVLRWNPVYAEKQDPKCGTIPQ